VRIGLVSRGPRRLSIGYFGSGIFGFRLGSRMRSPGNEEYRDEG
jgi:hypothetical protein